MVVCVLKGIHCSVSWIQLNGHLLHQTTMSSGTIERQRIVQLAQTLVDLFMTMMEIRSSVLNQTAKVYAGIHHSANRVRI